MLTAILISVIAFIISLALLQTAVVKRRYTRKRQQGLQMIQLLFQLLESIPQHRGLTNTLLQGNQTAKEKCLSLQKNIAQQLKLAQQAHPELAHNPCYIDITRGWDDITRSFSSLTAAVSFKKHTAVVSNLLELISDIGIQSKLNNSQDHALHGLIDIGVNILPPVTEALGQARGIGAGAATQEKLTTQSRSQLNYLYKKATQICGDTASVLKSQNTTDTLDFTQCQKSINLFLNTLDKELLSAEKIEIKSEHYFAIASDAIGHSFKQLHSVMEKISQSLDSEYASQNSKWYFHLFFTILTMLVVVGLLIK